MNEATIMDEELRTHIEKLRRIRKRKGFPVLYHVTSAAQEILAAGFVTRSQSVAPSGDYPAGVRLSNRPLDPNDGVIGDSVLLVCFGVPLRRLREFEWEEDGQAYREWLIPAAFISEFATVGVRGQPMLGIPASSIRLGCCQLASTCRPGCATEAVPRARGCYAGGVLR